MKTHGFSIGIERHGITFFLSLKATGTLTHEDYQEITPLIEGALKGVKNPLVYALFDITELDGWEPRAAWDDFRLGMKFRNDFKRAAILGQGDLQEKLSKVADWFMPGEVEFFKDKEVALNWLSNA